MLPISGTPPAHAYTQAYVVPPAPWDATIDPPPDEVEGVPPGTLNGMIGVFGDETPNHIVIQEDEYDLDGALIDFRFISSAAPAVAPRYPEVYEDLVDAVSTQIPKRAWMSRLLSRAIAPLAFASAMLEADSTDKLEQGPWIKIWDLSGLVQPIPPCRPVRHWGDQISDFAPAREVKCPTLREFADQIPPTLFVDAQGGNDIVDVALHDFSGMDPLVWDRIVWGGEANDIIYGTSKTDILAGEEGSDEIYGRAGDDEIWGHEPRLSMMRVEPDTDALFGGPGNDLIFGQAGSDLVDGGPDDDDRNPYTHLGEYTADVWQLLGSQAALQGGFSKDVVIGGEGEDTMAGNEEADTMLASETDLGGTVEEPDPLVDCQGSWLQPPNSGTEYFRASLNDNVVNCSQELSRPVRQTDVYAWAAFLARTVSTPFPWENW